jgi:hypothetical protein
VEGAQHLVVRKNGERLPDCIEQMVERPTRGLGPRLTGRPDSRQHVFEFEHDCGETPCGDRVTGNSFVDPLPEPEVEECVAGHSDEHVRISLAEFGRESEYAGDAFYDTIPRDGRNVADSATGSRGVARRARASSMRA